eukprot:TRINITY_DN36429_c0_g1_i1.p1 TRINITY_DN36429_c0_g1~~TRINITY_DN36429_c0_g1_i1.p1  ORF type:complete len:332 (-),score=89.68 TRINITY_DN36429_c0_g1_i1:78-968(-)
MAVGKQGTSSGGELVKGYKLLRLPIAAGSPVTKGLLVKRHEARDPEEKASAGRTLFVTHLDGFATEAQLQKCFSTGFGPVEKVELKAVEKRASKAEQRADGVKLHVVFARVIFKDASSVQKALESATGRITAHAVLPPPAPVLKEQLRVRKSFYRDPDQLRHEIDEWMANFDEQKELQRRQARESAVDDDGFTKVVSGITRTADGLTIRAAKRAAPTTGAFAQSIRAEKDQGTAVEGPNGGKKKKKKSKEMADFYRFQQREKSRDEIMDHRKRQWSDAEKIKVMRKSKRFKLSSES